MKRTVLTILAAALVWAAVGGSAQATEVGYGRKFGLGVVLGAPTGLSAKLWVAPTNALDFGLGFYGGFFNNCWRENGGTVCERGGSNVTTFNMDYLWQSNIVRSTAQLDWHLGVGGRAWFVGGNCSGDCVNVGARAPFGLDLMFNNPSFLEVFFEIAPVLYLIQGPALHIEGGLGVRFYF